MSISCNNMSESGLILVTQSWCLTKCQHPYCGFEEARLGLRGRMMSSRPRSKEQSCQLVPAVSQVTILGTARLILDVKRSKKCQSKWNAPGKRNCNHVKTQRIQPGVCVLQLDLSITQDRIQRNFQEIHRCPLALLACHHS